MVKTLNTPRRDESKKKKKEREIGLMFLPICLLRFTSLAGCPPNSKTIINGTQKKESLFKLDARSRLQVAAQVCLQ